MICPPLEGRVPTEQNGYEQTYKAQKSASKGLAKSNKIQGFDLSFPGTLFLSVSIFTTSVKLFFDKENCSRSGYVLNCKI